MYAGASPARSFARPGAMPGGGSDRSISPAYQRENAETDLSLRIGASAFSVQGGRDAPQVVAVYHTSWNAMGAPASSRPGCAFTGELFPPAESPATAMRPASAPNS